MANVLWYSCNATPNCWLKIGFRYCSFGVHPSSMRIRQALHVVLAKYHTLCRLYYKKEYDFEPVVAVFKSSHRREGSFFLAAKYGGIDSGRCIYGGNHPHLLILTPQNDAKKRTLIGD